MKKLNITKEQFEKSRYFKNKYGTLEYVSESGKMFKTDKGKVLMFKEYGKKVYPAANGCTINDMGDCLIVTNKDGLNIGQCRTMIEAEVIADEAEERTRRRLGLESTKKFGKKFVKENNGIYEVNEIDDRVMGAVENALNNAQDCFADELEKQGFRGYDGDSGGGFYFNDRRNKKTYYVRIGIADLQECDDYEGDDL